MRLSREDTHETLIRNYSLSNWAGAGNYRISVKREKHGAASNYIHSQVRVGDILEVAAPRGTFFLADAETPVILMSGGVGVTPVLSMLHTLAAIESPRQVWWLHAARDQSQHPFAVESRAHLPVGPPGPGPQVQFARSGITAPFGPPATSLLEFSEVCDVPVQWSCRTGVCHNCETALISGTVDYNLEPLEPPAPGNILMCCTQPAEPVVIDL